MIESSKPQRVLVLLIGSASDDVEQLQALLDEDHIQWHTIAEHDLLPLQENADKVDCILLRYDGSLKSLEILSTIRSFSTHLPVIVYGSHWQVPDVVHAMKLGATEVCEYPEQPAALVESFARCTSHEIARQPHYSSLIPKSILARLTSEEARILHLLVQGRTTKEVGATLDVSIRTVHYRKKELLRKLGRSADPSRKPSS